MKPSEAFVLICCLIVSGCEAKNLLVPVTGQVHLFTNLAKYTPVLDAVKSALHGSNLKITDVPRNSKICDVVKSTSHESDGLIVVVSDFGSADFCYIQQPVASIQLSVHLDQLQLHHKSVGGYAVTGTKIRGDAVAAVSLLKSAFFDVFVDHYLHGGDVSLADVSIPRRGWFNMSMPIIGWILIGAIITGGVMNKWEAGKGLQTVEQTIAELELLKPEKFRSKPRTAYSGVANVPIANDDFRNMMRLVTEYVIDYCDHPEIYEVTTSIKPGHIFQKLPAQAPYKADSFADIMKDVYKVIMPGLTHWQHPRFHAYFCTGRSVPDLLAEIISSAVSVINFSWDSSPSITELEIMMVNWVGRAFGLPESFLFKNIYCNESSGGGAMQDSATDAILIAMLSARLKHLTMDGPVKLEDRQNEHLALTKLVAYASSEAHSCIEKSAMVCLVHLRPVNVDENCSMRGPAFEKQVIRDIERGLKPFFVHVTLGTTATCAFDNLKEIAAVAKKYDIWVHVDAAYAGSAWVCPEFRYFMEGMEDADSLDINLHKMFLLTTSGAFLFSKHGKLIKNTMTYSPAYLKNLKSRKKEATDFRNWSISLSRRPRALKVWFLLRLYGIKGMQEYIRNLVRCAARMKSHLEKDPRVEIYGQQVLPLVCFRLKMGPGSEQQGNKLTAKLAIYINNTRRLLVTPAKPNGTDIIRISMSHQQSLEAEVDESYRILSELIEEFLLLSNKKALSQRELRFRNDVGIVGSPGVTTADTMRSITSLRTNKSTVDTPRDYTSAAGSPTKKSDMKSVGSPQRRDNEEINGCPDLKTERTPPKDENSNRSDVKPKKKND